jgi:16S rRNA (uracil1498-N3)-methyltransferase
VLRLGSGDRVKLFDDRTGEWLAEIGEAGRKRVTLTVGERLRDREAVPDLWLLFAPIKRGRIDWLVEKATELGVARLIPVITQRTVVDRLNLDRLRAHIVEAAEQCERTALPNRRAAQARALLAAWPAERRCSSPTRPAASRSTPSPAPPRS